ncbi:hypothetical protein [Salinibacterium sp. ZJ454]|uniref:hypothetical protein n=1 Tax=Salinibacterium sp. ZJ454 TaxID=2708339 RepID=UPI0014230D08|nr:hypothetical protein [Salinibacterium sp. ZJ454]
MRASAEPGGEPAAGQENGLQPGLRRLRSLEAAFIFVTTVLSLILGGGVVFCLVIAGLVFGDGGIVPGSTYEEGESGFWLFIAAIFGGLVGLCFIGIFFAFDPSSSLGSRTAKTLAIAIPVILLVIAFNASMMPGPIAP